MKTICSGKTEILQRTTETIAYSWRFEDAEDHEHPYILTVAVDGHTRSEGYEHDIGDAEAFAEAYGLAVEIHAAAKS